MSGWFVATQHERSTLPPGGRCKERGALPGAAWTWAEGSLALCLLLRGLRQAWRGWGCGEGSAPLLGEVVSACVRPGATEGGPAVPSRSPLHSVPLSWGWGLGGSPGCWGGSAPGLPSLPTAWGPVCSPPVSRLPVPPARSGPAPPAPPARHQARNPPQTPLQSQGHQQEGPGRPLGRRSSLAPRAWGGRGGGVCAGGLAWRHLLEMS